MPETTDPFHSLIQQFCDLQGWVPDSLDEKYAVLRFNMQSGRSKTLYIINYSPVVELSVPSLAVFDAEDKIPHYLSTILLKRGALRKIGYWCIVEIEGKQVYAVMHNADLPHLDAETFGDLVRALVSECDDFEETLVKMLRD